MAINFFCMSRLKHKDQLEKRIVETLAHLPGEWSAICNEVGLTPAQRIQIGSHRQDYKHSLTGLKNTIIASLENKNQDDDLIKKIEDEYVQILCCHPSSTFPKRTITLDECIKAINESRNYKLMEGVFTLIYIGGAIAIMLLLSANTGYALLAVGMVVGILYKFIQPGNCVSIGHEMSKSQKAAIRDLDEVNSLLREYHRASPNFRPDDSKHDEPECDDPEHHQSESDERNLGPAT